MTVLKSAAATDDVVDALRVVVEGEVSASTSRRALYSSDASNYRVTPRVVVIPRTLDDLIAVTEVSRTLGVPLTMRGGGTSVAGNAIGPGIVVDTSRYLTRILEIDPESSTALVEPGVIVASLNIEARKRGLRFGPDPSTHARATVAGVIGNNACGAHALAYGRAADNTVELDVIDGLGRRFLARDDLSVIPGLDALVRDNLELLRLEFGRFGRQVSGYSLEHLLPENGSSLARTLAGTEGTIATTLTARVRLVKQEVAPVLAVFGYPDMPSAADAVPGILSHRPLAIEGLDARLIEVIRGAKGRGSVPELPEGGGWLLVEVGGDTADQAYAAARALAKDAGTTSVRIVPAGPEAAALWRIREDGAGLAGRTPSGKQAWPGWEDAAVLPAKLGDYLREFDALMDRYGVEGLPYGHFGDGCVHVRIDLPLDRDGSVLRSFVQDAAALVVAHGGSMSGEHGDGRARSELLPSMYSPEAIRLLERFKGLFDPSDLMNPGIIVRPAPLDDALRRPRALPILRASGFSFAHDDGDFTKAVHRCVGVGKCRADVGGFMCPSYQATKDENDVTRGRARMLQEMANGALVSGGWRDPDVHDALDLCLSCKACSRDCPAGVDMAQYKSEVLHRSYRGRLRPVNHYVLGWLPRWARLARIAPRLVNGVLGLRPLARVVLALGGMDTRRSIPSFAAAPFSRTLREARRVVPELHRLGHAPAAHPGAVAGAGGVPTVDDGQHGDRFDADLTHDHGHGAHGGAHGGHHPQHVVLWVDSFSDAFTPGNAGSAIRVLEDAGYHVIIPDEDACCGLTWISTGQLDGAKRRLAHLLDVLAPYAGAGIPIVGLEPSCTAVLRSDLVDLLPEDPRSRQVADATQTLAEVLAATAGWTPPDLSDVTAVVQPHCHQYSVMGFEADRAILTRAGATITTLAGCCGLAGNFGMEKGHYETSVAVAEHALLPALRARPEGAIFLADGFSCRTQADQLAGVDGSTLSELLASRLDTPRAQRVL